MDTNAPNKRAHEVEDRVDTIPKFVWALLILFVLAVPLITTLLQLGAK